MMADDVLFEVDASQIVAKLHLAGVQAAPRITTEDFFINSGIKNDNPKANPNDPGKVTFDLKNSSGEYELGYVTTVVYHKAYDLENTINEIYDHLSKTAGDKSSIQDKPDSNEHKEFEKRKEELKTILTGYNVKFDEKNLDTADGIKEIRTTAINEIGKNDEDAYKTMISEKKKAAVDCIKSYMDVFAGTDNVEQIKEQSLKMIDLSDKTKDSNANGLVKNFEIQPMSEQEKAKMIEQFKVNFRKDPTKNNCKQKICFIVKYTLNVDK